jgi:hypothetical protein
MMFPSGKQEYDDEMLTRYLLGGLPEGDVARIDELSITDDDTVHRLNALENDLVDAYVSGELSGDTLIQFQSSYLSSFERRAKVAFAVSLLAREDRAAAQISGHAAVPTLQAHTPQARTPQPNAAGNRSAKPWRGFPIPRWTPNWALAAAALLLIAGGAYLLREHALLKNQLDRAQAERVELDRRQANLQKQLAEARQPSLSPAEASDSLPTPPRPLRTVSLVLYAQMRGASQMASLSLPQATASVLLQVQLEFDDFPAYRAVLKDSASDRTLWRSKNLNATAAGRDRAVSVDLPASLLASQVYSLELIGIPQNGPAEPIGSYPFNVVIK